MRFLYANAARVPFLGVSDWDSAFLSCEGLGLGQGSKHELRCTLFCFCFLNSSRCCLGIPNKTRVRLQGSEFQCGVKRSHWGVQEGWVTSSISTPLLTTSGEGSYPRERKGRIGETKQRKEAESYQLGVGFPSTLYQSPDC